MAGTAFFCSDVLSIASLALELPPGKPPGRRHPFTERVRQATWGERGPACAEGDVEHVHVSKRTHFSHSYIPIRASVYVCAPFRADRAPQTLIPEILRRQGALRPGIQRSSLRPKLEIQIFCRTSTFTFPGCAAAATSPSFGGSFPEEGTTQTAAKVFSRSGGPSAALVQPWSRPPSRGAARQKAALQ